MKKELFAVAAAMLLLGGCTQNREVAVSAASPAVTSSDLSVSAPDAEPQKPVTDASETAQETSGEIPSSASEPEKPLTVQITVPEGYTLARIGMLLEEKEICTAQELLAAAQTGDFSEFPLIAAQQATPNRCFALEGYLFPDTYEIYTNETPDAILRRILAHTEQRISPELRTQIEQSGFTIDEIITLASIIEKEAFGAAEMPKISSVLHNRLEQKMRLQCDVTIAYVEGAIKPFITGDLNRYNRYYNTYKCDALPAGAICNPGIEAIRAALAPAETEALFFVTDSEKNYYYAETFEEHQKNVVAAGAGEESNEVAVGTSLSSSEAG